MSYGGRGGDHRQLKCFEERGNWRVPRTGRYGIAVGRTATRNPLASCRGASWGPKSVVTRCGEGSRRGGGKGREEARKDPRGFVDPLPLARNHSSAAARAGPNFGSPPPNGGQGRRRLLVALFFSFRFGVVLVFLFSTSFSPEMRTAVRISLMGRAPCPTGVHCL